MKMSYYFRFFIIFSINFYAIRGHAQTYIGATIGVDFLNASTISSTFYDIDNNTPKENKSLIVGIYIEQYLSKRIKLTVHGNFTSKSHKVADWGIAGNPFSSIKYKEINSSFSINFMPIKHFYIGGGIGLNYLGKMRTIQRDTQKEYLLSKVNTKIVGGVISASYHFKSFRLNLQYFQGRKFINDFNGDVAFFDKFNSFQISLAYGFKLFDKLERGKGTDCPEF